MAGQKILIVDDSEPTLQLYRFVVQKLGEDAEPVVFQAPEQALLWSAGMHPAIVVCDQNMPGIDGLAFIEKLRAQPGNGDVPVIMVTAINERGVRREAVRLGVSAFLSKPVDPIEFMAYLKNLLEQRRMRSELVDRVSTLSAQVHETSNGAIAREVQTLEALLATAKMRDPEIESHVRRAARIGEIIARRMMLSQRDVELFAAAAPFYDMGKVGLPDRILISRGRLDPRDLTLVQQHAAHGAEVLRGDSPLRKAAAEMAEMHHERYDGSGYPHKLRGDAIPLFARIVAVADVYVAMTSSRRYRDAVAPGVARADIERGSGSRFDPSVVSAFLAAKSEIDQEAAVLSRV